jgi:hypothetical protein
LRFKLLEQQRKEIHMGKVLGLAFVFGIVGLFMGVGLGLLLTGGKTNDQDQKMIVNLVMAIGWGAGGIIGALAGLAAIVQDKPRP